MYAVQRINGSAITHGNDKSMLAIKTIDSYETNQVFCRKGSKIKDFGVMCFLEVHLFPLPSTELVIHHWAVYFCPCRAGWNVYEYDVER